MQIKVISIENQKVKSYYQLNVVYESQWGNKTFKIFSFANPAVYAVLKDAQAGEEYNITTGKDAKDYDIWTSATKLAASASSVAPSVSPAKAAWVPDADRQRLIVKQSSITAALKYLELNEVSPDAPSVVFNLADEFVKYVYDVEELEAANTD